MRWVEIFILLSILIFIGYGMVQSTTPPMRVPDSRIADLELRVENLENWAQRQGMKYKGGK
jgi:hypothetical protein